MRMSDIQSVGKQGSRVDNSLSWRSINGVDNVGGGEQLDAGLNWSLRSTGGWPLLKVQDSAASGPAEQLLLSIRTPPMSIVLSLGDPGTSLTIFKIRLMS